MQGSAQKKIELQHLCSFQHRYQDFPTGELIEGETPDFLIVTPSGRKIGIEHTQVFMRSDTDKTPEQADEATKRFILTAAKQHAEFLGLPPANVWLFFNPQYLRQTIRGKRKSFTKAQRQRIAEDIATFVGEHMPPQGCSIDCSSLPGQPRQVDQILIGRDGPVHYRDWRCLEWKAIQYNAIDQLQNALFKKDKKYAVCLNKCDECWLLVVADSFFSPVNIHPDEASLSYFYTSPFDHVFFLDLALRYVVVLKTMPKS